MKNSNKDIKRSIKHKHLNNNMYKLDKFLKLFTVKIKNVNYIESIKGDMKYRVKYGFGLNKINPLVWIYIIIITGIETTHFLKDEFPSFVSMGSYNEFIKIKERINE